MPQKKEKSKPEGPRHERLRKVAEALNKELIRTGGRANITVGSDMPPSPRIPTGILSLDFHLGGGFVGGNFQMLWGPENVGKTSLCLSTIANAQRLDPEYTAAWVDGSASFGAMKEYAQSLGVDLDRFFPIQADSIEYSAEIVRRLIEMKCIDLCVLDDLAACGAMKHLWEKSGKGEAKHLFDPVVVGAQAAANAHFLRVMTQHFGRNQIPCLFTQQVRAKIGDIQQVRMALDKTYELTGGHAVKHWLVWAGFVRKGANNRAPTIDSTLAGDRCGHAIVVKTTKMKIDKAQFMDSEFTTQWVNNRGIEPGRDAFCFLDGRELIVAHGAHRSFSPEIAAVMGIDPAEKFPGRHATEEILGRPEIHRKLYEHFVPNLDLQVRARKKDLKAAAAAVVKNEDDLQL